MSGRVDLQRRLSALEDRESVGPAPVVRVVGKLSPEEWDRRASDPDPGAFAGLPMIEVRRGVVRR